MNLPNLQQYRNNLLASTGGLPLKTIQIPTNGLLAHLPPPSHINTGWPWQQQKNVAHYAHCTDWPKVTIVTPSYNQADFLEQTIRSVLLQNYPNLEYIVIDGGSTDGSKAILEKYAPWLSYWQSQPDRGQSHAINQGFSIATGQYYAWLNSDDYYLQDTLQTVASAFLNFKVAFVYGYTQSFDTANQKLTQNKVLPLLDYFLRLPALMQPSCFWHAKIHQPLWEELQCSIDYELWQRLVKGNSRKLLKKNLSVANVHIDAKTHNETMGTAWQKDHELICSPNAHGSVSNWNTIMFLNRLYMRIFNLFN